LSAGSSGAAAESHANAQLGDPHYLAEKLMVALHRPSSGDATSPKGECATPGAFSQATKGRCLPNWRRGVTITFCDGASLLPKRFSMSGIDEARPAVQHPSRLFSRVTVSVWSGQMFLK
jgi:hypothetical protein